MASYEYLIAAVNSQLCHSGQKHTAYQAVHISIITESRCRANIIVEHCTTPVQIIQGRSTKLDLVSMVVSKFFW